MIQKHSKNKAPVTTISKLVECDIDPVLLFQSLQRESGYHNRMLLESCKIEDKQNLKSILVNKSALRIECFGSQVTIRSISRNGNNAIEHLSVFFDQKLTTDSHNNFTLTISYPEQKQQQLDEESRLKRITPIDCLRQINQAFETQTNQDYAVFLCGLFAFDFIASFETLPELPITENSCADFVFYLAEEIIVFDHQTQRCNIISNIFASDKTQQNYFEQSRRIEMIAASINSRHLAKMNDDPFIDSIVDMQIADIQNIAKAHLSNQSSPVECDINDEDFHTIVLELKNDIIAGNIFQVVPSRTFSIPCKSELLSYQILKKTNPSPYMFFMSDEKFTLFGASPESALKYHSESNHVDLYPIAGTRPRGKYDNGKIDHDLDKRLEAELKLDQKEISEHMMLVDLARNDIARISKAESLQIPKLLEVDRYSQVMHLVSCVQGELKNNLDCFHAYQACMNMGTLTGAPKIKATELIRLTEKKRRGSYGGAVGYINTKGDMDTCIVIRSAFCQNGIAHIQAGAGVVYDSDPVSEADETKSKANAVIGAIQVANEHTIVNDEINDQEVKHEF